MTVKAFLIDRWHRISLDLRVYFAYFLIVLVLHPTLRAGAQPFVSGGMNEDFWRYLFGLESLARGEIPLWNPYNGNGQPFYFYFVLNSFPSPLDIIPAIFLRIAAFVSNPGMIRIGTLLILAGLSLYSLVNFKLVRLFINQGGLHPNSRTVDFLIAFVSGPILMMFVGFEGSYGFNVVYIFIKLFPLFAIYYLLKWVWEGSNLSILLSWRYRQF